TVSRMVSRSTAPRLARRPLVVVQSKYVTPLPLYCFEPVGLSVYAKTTLLPGVIDGRLRVVAQPPEVQRGTKVHVRTPCWPTRVRTFLAYVTVRFVGNFPASRGGAAVRAPAAEASKSSAHTPTTPATRAAFTTRA